MANMANSLEESSIDNPLEDLPSSFYSPDLFCPVDDVVDTGLPDGVEGHLLYYRKLQQTELSIQSRVIVTAAGEHEGWIGRIVEKDTHLAHLKNSQGEEVRDIALPFLKPYFRVGDWVIVSSGALLGLEGWVVGTDQQPELIQVLCIRAPDSLIDASHTRVISPFLHAYGSSRNFTARGPSRSFSNCIQLCCFRKTRIALQSIVEVHPLFLAEVLDTAPDTNPDICFFINGELQETARRVDPRIGREVMVRRPTADNSHPRVKNNPYSGVFDKGRLGSLRSIRGDYGQVQMQNAGNVKAFYLDSLIDTL